MIAVKKVKRPTPKLSDFNDPPEMLLKWLTREQKAGRIYSQKELLDLSNEERRSLKAPAYSRVGIKQTIKTLVDKGEVEFFGRNYKKAVVVGVKLPVGALSFG